MIAVTATDPIGYDFEQYLFLNKKVYNTKYRYTQTYWITSLNLENLLSKLDAKEFVVIKGLSYSANVIDSHKDIEWTVEIYNTWRE